MAGITGFKVALCLSYLRILQNTNNRYRIIIWIVLISCVFGHLAGTLILIFQCSPVSIALALSQVKLICQVRKSWRPLTPGHCLPNVSTFYSLAAVSIFFDCIIFCLPIPILAQLHINARRKAALMGIFALGLFTTVCSVLRMIQIVAIGKTGNSTMLVLWGTVELNVGVSSCDSYVNNCLSWLLADHPNLSPNFDASLHLLPGEVNLPLQQKWRRTVSQTRQ